MKTQAFTLIETIIYLALFSVIIGGSITSAFFFLEHSDKNNIHAQVAGEAEFILTKIEYLLSGTTQISSPSSGLACILPCIVSVTKAFSIPRDITIFVQGNTLYVKKDYAPPVAISGNSFQVNAFSAVHFQKDAKGSKRIKVLFTLNTLSPQGTTVSGDFYTTYYLK